MAGLRSFVRLDTRRIALLAMTAAIFALWFGVWLRVLPLKPRATFTMPSGSFLGGVGGTRMVTYIVDEDLVCAGPAHVWDCVSGRMVAEFSVLKGMEDIDLSANGDVLICRAYSNDDGPAASKLRLYDVATRRELLQIDSGCEWFESHLSPDGQFLVVGRREAPGSLDVVQLLYSTADCKVLGSIVDANRASRFDEFTFAPDGRTLAVWRSLSNRLELWEIPGRRFLGFVEELSSVRAFSPDGQVIAAAHSAYDGKPRPLVLVDARTAQVQRELAGHQFPISGLAFGAKGRTVIAVHNGSVPWNAHLRVMTWDTGSGSIVGRYEHVRRDTLQIFPVRETRHVFVVAEEQGWVLDLATHEWRGPVPRHAFTLGGTILPSHDERYIVLSEGEPEKSAWVDFVRAHTQPEPADSDGRLIVWDLHAHREVARLPEGEKSWLPPDGDSLVTIFADGLVQVWDLPPRRTLGLMLVLSAAPTLLFSGLFWWRWGRRI